MRGSIHASILAISLLCSLFFQSCLYTTHHFNTGETIPAGKTRVTFGMGSHQFNQSKMVKFSMDYRVGLSEKWGPFPGADMRWHLEAPTNPGTMEFDARLAMPNLQSKWFHHSVSAGWGIGMWADNSLFLDYALSSRLGSHTLFSSTRITKLATQFFNLFKEDMDRPLTSHQYVILQISGGHIWRLPNIPVIPDFTVIQGIITFPRVPAGPKVKNVERDPHANINVGAGWNF